MNRVIPSPPVQVCWRIGAVDYVMMQIRPADLANMKKDHPDVLGIPTYYAIVDDDVDWWPSSKEGEPVVGIYGEPTSGYTGYRG